MPRLIIALVCLVSFVFADFPSFAQEQSEAQRAEPPKADADLSSMSWAEIVRYLFRPLETAEDKERDAFFGRLRTLLDREGITHIQCNTTTDGELSQRTNIYYRPGELHVIHVPIAAASKGEQWNLVVKDGKAYEWRTGEAQGIVSDVNDKDMIDYLIYLTDPAMFLSQTYRDFLRRPKTFLPPNYDKQKDWTELKYKEPYHGIEALFVRKDPFWLHGIEIKNANLSVRLTFELPHSVDSIPAKVFDRLKNIKFDQSNLTLHRHMRYL